ncbi:MAG: threonylcarbamoyl-AMP synthase [Oscillospiraceae bacterium]|nr:threonylcarbamoyl-AMP synthase [Oscillospiraceae bacterium]
MIKTKLFSYNIGNAAEIIKNGGLVAVPTETVYGLAADGLNAEAVEKIYEVKGRPSVKPLALMVSSSDEFSRYCADVPHQATALAKRFWPGPLTIVMKANKTVPDIVLAGGSTVGLRCPDSDLTLQLIREAGVPLAAPSANPSGSKSPNSAAEVLDYFDGLIDVVIDGGVCSLGVASTLIDMSAVPYKILRQGALPEAAIKKALADDLKVIGITGGSGSGKTTALNCLRALGALVIDCDALYHDMLRSDAELKAAVGERFPEAVATDGEINRKALAATVFGNAAALNDLNCITHAFIARRIREKLEDYAFSGGMIAALDAVELLASELSSVCDHTVAVVSDREKRIERIMQRDNISREDAARRIDAQKSDEYYISNCSYVLVNNSSFEEFENKCNEYFGGLFCERYQK